MIGRNTPGSDFNVDLPEALLAGHPSLPYRSGDNVVLVNNSEPVTCVAYALSSDLYEEQLDSWKLIIHKEVAASVAPDRNRRSIGSPVTTNWSRAALETILSVPFKYSICEIPLHLSLLSGTSSANALNSPWEFSTIAYFPLQVRWKAFFCLLRAISSLFDSSVLVLRVSLKCFGSSFTGRWTISFSPLLTSTTGTPMVGNQEPRFSAPSMTAL